MGGPVVHNPEHPVRAGVRLGGHHLLGQPEERRDPGGVLAPAGHPSAVDIPGGQVGHGAAPLVVVLDAHRAGLARRQGGVAAAAGLDRGLLIGADHIVVRAQRLTVSDPGIQVEHLGRLGGELRITDRDPGPVLPGLESVAGQHRRIVDAEIAMPQRAASSRARSGPLHCDSGTPDSAGSAHASAMTSARSAAVEAGGRPLRGASFSPGSRPAATGGATCGPYRCTPQLPGDRGVILPGCCGEHDRRAQPVTVRPTHRPGAGRQDGFFLAGQDNLTWAWHRHAFFMPYPRQCPARRRDGPGRRRR